MSVRPGCFVSSSPNTLPSLDRSMPAQNARPAPVTITARTESSSLTSRNDRSSSCAIVTVNELSCSGRFSVMVSTPSSMAWSRVSYAMDVSFRAGQRRVRRAGR